MSLVSFDKQSCDLTAIHLPAAEFGHIPLWAFPPRTFPLISPLDCFRLDLLLLLLLLLVLLLCVC